MSFPAQLSIVTLGVTDLERSARFYRDLGWEQLRDLGAGITWFRTTGSYLGLFGWDDLAEDVGLPEVDPDAMPAFRGSTLAVNLGSREQVDEAFAVALAAGARVLKPPVLLSWGGYSGYFADPDGHLWEVAHNPDFPIDDHGRTEIPPAGA